MSRVRFDETKESRVLIYLFYSLHLFFSSDYPTSILVIPSLASLTPPFNIISPRLASPLLSSYPAILHLFPFFSSLFSPLVLIPVIVIGIDDARAHGIRGFWDLARQCTL